MYVLNKSAIKNNYLIGTFCIVNSQTPSNYLYKCDNLIGTFCIVNFVLLPMSCMFPPNLIGTFCIVNLLDNNSIIS